MVWDNGVESLYEWPRFRRVLGLGDADGLEFNSEDKHPLAGTHGYRKFSAFPGSVALLVCYHDTK